MHHLRDTTIAVTGSLLIALVTACGNDTPDPGPRFDNETKSGELTCLKHQPEPPGARYTDDTRRQTDDTLVMLRYYTTNGTKSYCDDKGPNDTDRAWLQLYVDLGANRANVTTLLDEPR